MEKPRTERVYDEEMLPLIERLAEIAMREKMPLLCSVGIVLEKDGALCLGTGTTFRVESASSEFVGIVNRFALSLEILTSKKSELDTASEIEIRALTGPPAWPSRTTGET